MSWSLYNTNVPKENLVEEIQKAADSQLANQPFDSWDDAVQDQMDVAARAAELIAEKLPSEAVNFGLSGHARTGATDLSTINVSISEAYQPEKS